MAGADKSIIIIGAGPGGLTSAMLLASRGFKVTVLEKQGKVGGRNGELTAGPYHHDIGPTFLMMRHILDQVFAESGRKLEDYLSLVKLDPMYRLDFGDKVLHPSSDPAAMKSEIERVFPGQSAGLDAFLRGEGKRLNKMYPCLQKDYSSLSAFLRPEFIAALPYLSLGKSLYGKLSEYFKDEALRLSFTFQSKYLGMSPWDCPAAFAIIPYLEYAYGVWHVMGGLSRISEAMAKVAQEQGASIRLGAEVERLRVEQGRAKGVLLKGGERLDADAVIVNADFGHAMSSLVEPGLLKRWSPAKLAARPFSCSTYMLYLGLDTLYRDAPHHTILFAKDYQRNLQDITRAKRLSQDTSVYVRNASVTDPSLAPEGHSALYILVPVANNESGLDWAQEAPGFRERVLDIVEARLGMQGLRSHIREERCITPWDWEHSLGVYKGATFNLAHSLDQMLYLRPHNRFEEIGGVYLVGGGTHPGSGLPTIYESGRISANLLCRDQGVPYQEPAAFSLPLA
jgi:phytoene desaturase